MNSNSRIEKALFTRESSLGTISRMCRHENTPNVLTHFRDEILVRVAPLASHQDMHRAMCFTVEATVDLLQRV